MKVSLYGFLENRPFQTSLISFLDEITDFTDTANALGVIDLDICRCMQLF